MNKNTIRTAGLSILLFSIFAFSFASAQTYSPISQDPYYQTLATGVTNNTAVGIGILSNASDLIALLLVALILLYPTLWVIRYLADIFRGK